MFLEGRTQLCCCRESLLEEELKQEKMTQQYSPRSTLSKQHGLHLNHNHLSKRPRSTVFSFRESKEEVRSQQKQNNQLSPPPVIRFSSKQHLLPLKIEPMKTTEDQKPIIYVKAVPEKRFEMNSPRKLELVSIKSPPSRIHSNIYAVTVEPQKPKLKFQFKNIEAIKTMQGKRIRTAEEETQYSSKQSQVHFRNSNESTEYQAHSFFQKKITGGSKNCFCEQAEQSELNSPLGFPSCREVSAREEADYSISNEFLQNARSIQTIVGSSGLKSKMTSKGNSRQTSNVMTFAKLLPPQSPCLSPRNSSEVPDLPQLTNHCSETPKMPFSPIRHTSPSIGDEKMYGSKINSSLFYSDQTSRKNIKSPRVSVLSVLDMEEKSDSQEQELRDKIDDDILLQKTCSLNASPIVSANNSLKNVEERRERKVVYFKQNFEHSRQLSEELNLMKQIRFRQKRTNTIESLQSSGSEQSYLDIKFMKQHRSRRQVSKLIRD